MASASYWLEAEDAGRPIRVGRHRGAIASTTRRMAAIVARIGGQRRRAVQEVGLLRKAHGGIGREQHRVKGQILFERATRWHELGLRQKSDGAVKCQPVVENQEP